MQAETSLPIDALALVAHQLPVAMHRHHAVQMVISLDHPYAATLNGRRYEAVHGFLIDANVPHACESTLSTVLVVSVDADTGRGRALRHRLNGRPVVLIGDLLDEERVLRFREAYWSEQDGHETGFDPLMLVDLLSGTRAPQSESDLRVNAARRYISQEIGRTLRLREIADAVALSEGRLRHLFQRDTGIPISTYVLWTRMKVALHALATLGMNLAEAAHHAGYADHAHFTRTFRRMFGVSPSLILKHSRFIRIFDITLQEAETASIASTDV